MMYLTIPNNVDSTYTGVFLTSISLTFYAVEGADRAAEGEDIHKEGGITNVNKAVSKQAVATVPLTRTPTIIPLTNAALQADAYPWDNMQIVGTQALSYPLTSSINALKTSSELVTGMYVDVFASAHGCEEFYYSNVPSENASDFGKNN
jgi:hypothetical protein